ncbi:hypothetical protein [Nonomuraea jabiensis]|uniref:hypothetical protein n=1 Tax=Nonomuraea jabiensis TaxID=882448 RepID=UPI003D72992C
MAPRARGRATFALSFLALVGAAACLLVLVFGAVRLSGADSTAWRQVAVLSATRYQWAPDAASPGGKALVQEYVKEIAGLPPGTGTVSRATTSAWPTAWNSTSPRRSATTPAPGHA